METFSTRDAYLKMSYGISPFSQQHPSGESGTSALSCLHSELEVVLFST